MAWLELTTTATVPAGATLDITVKEDVDGDGTAENSETQSIDDGTNTYTLDGFDGSPNNDSWLVIEEGNTDKTTAASLDSAQVEVSERFISAPATALTGSTPSPSLTTSGTVVLDAAVTALSGTTPAPGVSGTGTVTVSATESILTASTPAPELRLILNAPATSISATSPAPGISGTGSVTIAGAVSSLTSASPSPSVNPGSVTIDMVESALSAVTPTPSVDAVGTVTVSATASALSATTAGHLIGFGEWSYNGGLLGSLIEEARSPKELTLRLRSTAAQMEGTTRQFGREAGSVDVVVFSDGSWKAVDRSNSGLSYDITPPVGRRDLRQNDTFYVADYNETTIDQSSSKFEVEVTFLDDQQREADGDEVSQTRSSGEWLFEFDSGAVATASLRAESQSDTRKAVGSDTYVLHLDQQQAKVLETSGTYLDAVGVREVPDGDNYAEDNNSNGRNKVTVTAPPDKDDVLAGGEYVIRSWQTKWKGDDFYEVKVELSRSGQESEGKVSQVGVTTPEPTINNV